MGKINLAEMIEELKSDDYTDSDDKEDGHEKSLMAKKSASGLCRASKKRELKKKAKEEIQAKAAQQQLIIQKTHQSFRKDLGLESETDPDEGVDLFDMIKYIPEAVVKSNFNSTHFAKACQIIKAINGPNLKLKRPYFLNDIERVTTYDLAVAILRYGNFLNNALVSSKFFEKNTELQLLELEEILVVMYDLLIRDFRTHPKDPTLNDKYATIQKHLLGCRTKIMGQMARLRIKHKASSIEHLLPTQLRQTHNIDQNPLYAWINLKKIRAKEVHNILNRIGFVQTDFEDDVLIQENSFHPDENHFDLIRFHSKKKEAVMDSQLVNDGFLVVQDKSACIQVYALVKAIFFIETVNRDRRYLTISSGNIEVLQLSKSLIQLPELNPDLSSPDVREEWYEKVLDPGKYHTKPDCVIVTNAGSGRSIAHLASLLQEAVPKWLCRNGSAPPTKDDLTALISSKFVARPTLNVLAFGVPPQRKDEITHFFKKVVSMQNVKIYTESFADLSPKDARIKNACAILVNPPSSGSALKDPVSYICTEGGDEDILVHLGKLVKLDSNIAQDESLRFQASQIKYLKHALQFPQAKLILYTTCSLLKFENISVVTTCLKEANEIVDNQKARLLADMIQVIESNLKSINTLCKDKDNTSQARLFRDISYEVVDLNQVFPTYPKENFRGPFLEMTQNTASSGCFIALIRRYEKATTLLRTQVKTDATGTEPKLVKKRANTAVLPKRASISSLTNGKVTERELGAYLSKNYALKCKLLPNSEAYAITATTKFIPNAINGKRRMTKKAIVERLTAPTCSSLAKKTVKYCGSNPSGSANPSESTSKNPSKNPSLNASRTPSKLNLSTPIVNTIMLQRTTTRQMSSRMTSAYSKLSNLASSSSKKEEKEKSKKKIKKIKSNKNKS